MQTIESHSHSGATGVFAFMKFVHFLFTKNTADDIGSFTAVYVVGVLGAIIVNFICVGHVRYYFLM